MAKSFRDYFKSPQTVVLSVIIFVVFLVGLVLILSKSDQVGGTINPDQIRIQKGDKIVTVNKNGLVEYKTSTGVFYQTWNSVQIANFFAFMEASAREYLNNPNSSLCNTGYTVTLYLDGKEVTVCIAQDNELLDEVFQEFSDDGGSGDLSDIFDDLFDEGISTTVTPTLTPTPGVIAADEGEDIPSGGGGSSLPIVICDLNQEDVTSRTVISNILCAPDEPSPTPTLTPTPTPIS